NGELDDFADRMVVDVVDDGGDQCRLEPVFRHVFNGLQFNVEQIPDLAVLIQLVADAVKLQVGAVQPGFLGCRHEVRLLREVYAVRGGQHAVKPDLLGVPYGVQEKGRQRRLAAGEEHDHLAAGLERYRAVQDGFDVVKRRLVHVPHLIGIHEAGIAHHVAAVGQIDRQYGAPAISYRRGAVAVHAVIVGAAEVAAEEQAFNAPQKVGVRGHDVFKIPVGLAVLAHVDAPIFFDDLSLDLAGPALGQYAEVLL